MTASPTTPTDTTRRTTSEVLEAHLRRSKAREFEQDLADNYAADIVVLCKAGVLRGFDGMRESRQELRDTLQGAEYEIVRTVVEGEYAFIEWTAPGVCDGTDTFHIVGGEIVMQSIHYAGSER